MNLSKIEKYFWKIQFTTSQRMKIYSRLSRFISNGVPLTKALDTLYTHITQNGKKIKTPQAIAINSWLTSIRNGGTLSQSLIGWAEMDEVAVIHAGEMSGALDKAFENVIYINKSKKLIMKALFGLLYPLVLVSSTFFYLYIFGTQVVPAFEEILPVDKWNETGILMKHLSDFIQSDLVYSILGIIVFFSLIIFSLPRWTGRIRKRFEKLPIWSLYRTKVGCEFMISLCALIQAGVPSPEALLIMSRRASPWYKEKLIATRRMMLGGARNIGDALEGTKYDFPSFEMVTELKTYAALDGFEEMLHELGHQWLELSVEKIKLQMEIIKNIAIVFMGLTFMWIVSGIFSLEQLISSTAAMGNS
ncbi:type II secretion system F family protein [Serratia sp. UGAL515B_01]|uniref:type II secretion system F family protein n=1 Tax=Serratia sp. UGAL515B_01 TaxID=2986763 RepID=UPI0029554E5E|nr:type II secretion system F family protein [Serratia sp. UGAL515B_01]WON76961.1 type II secretion system F family protein [Serratia sp. UGAL515B_01]